MAGVSHSSACTTPRVRAELQASQEATRVLAVRYGLNPKTVTKWRKRTTTADQPMGPSRPRSTVLTEAEEAIVVEFRRRTLLPLDDVLGCLRASIPTLTRSALHRCLVRHGISRLPKTEEKTSKRKRFAETKIGYVHIDPCELRLAEGKLHMFLAIDLPGHRSREQVHPRRVLRCGHQDERGGLPAGGRGRVPVCDPHSADRQWHGLRRSTEEQNRAEPPLARSAHLRPGLPRAWHRTPADQTLSPLDERPSRADEPNREGRHHQGDPL